MSLSRVSDTKKWRQCTLSSVLSASRDSRHIGFNVQGIQEIKDSMLQGVKASPYVFADHLKQLAVDKDRSSLNLGLDIIHESTFKEEA